MIWRVITTTGFGCYLTGSIAFAAPVDFAHEIVPIFKEHCAKCHLDEEKKGGFSMNTRASLLEGGENGAVLEVGEGAESYFIEVLKTDDDEIFMPPKGDRVAPEKIALLQRWIDEGMPWEPGFTFAKNAWEPPLAPRDVELPPASSSTRTNPVDRLLDRYLEEKKQPQPPVSSDAEFLRRLYLDVLGLLPPADLAAAPPSRDQSIEAVLGNDVAYADHWLSFWNDLLRNDYSGTGFIDGGRKQVTRWLYQSLLDNKPYDQFVKELISPTAESEGFINGIKWRGNVNSSQTREVQFAQNISQVFLGINMKCASCHDSFIDRWKLEEAYSLAAIIATEPLEIHRCDKPTGNTATAGWIFPEMGNIDANSPKEERLRVLSGLMTSSENGRFSRTIVNRLWHRLMGRGIVHPVDAMETRPWDEDLLDWLANDFVAHGYDLKHTLRQIVSSSAYQSRAVVLKKEIDAEDYVFAGPIAKRLTAEQFVDAVWKITGTAPSQQQAGVIRAKASPASPNSTITGKWIWKPATDNALPKGGDLASFRKKIDFPKGKPFPTRAIVVSTADNSYQLFVNNRVVGEGSNWTEANIFDVTTSLKAGTNWFMLAAKNGGNAPNAAGAFAEIHLIYLDGTTEVIGTDSTWNFVPAVPDSRGRFTKNLEKWHPSAQVSNSIIWERNTPAIRSRIALASDPAPLPMVRASLTKSNLLLRSLGRPNREQVVTVRPEDLSTLQAIDLSNGDILASTLSQGAKSLASREPNREALITDLYLGALSRQPTVDERKIAAEIMGQPLSAQGVEDFLWALLMLPEFQIVR